MIFRQEILIWVTIGRVPGENYNGNSLIGNSHCNFRYKGIPIVILARNPTYGHSNQDFLAKKHFFHSRFFFLQRYDDTLWACTACAPPGCTHTKRRSKSLVYPPPSCSISKNHPHILFLTLTHPYGLSRAQNIKKHCYMVTSARLPQRIWRYRSAIVVTLCSKIQHWIWSFYDQKI